jgi:hypothetical protein
MQLAARKVLWENAQLRDLLSRKGVPEYEITVFIQSQDQARSAQPQNSDAIFPSKHALASANNSAADIAGAPSICTTPARLDLEPSTHSHSLRGHDTMSCESAANIIAGMRGHSDDDIQVRAQLGCQGNENCNVKNMKVFQVMEMD